MNILHLSDIHFGRNHEGYEIEDEFKKKDQISEDLIEFIGKIKDLKPEHIVVTGDIAWGGKKKEYDEALLWFKKLLKNLQLTGKDITFCVGNHDVNRAYANFENNYKDDSIKEIDDIYDYDSVHEMEPPIYEYDKFCEELGVEPFTYFFHEKLEYSYSVGSKDVIFSSGKKIRFTAFNTALLSFVPTISQDRMWIGKKQIESLMQYGIIPNDKVHYIISLFHHAERFLHPNEICEYDGREATLNLLRKNVDLILCGHTETEGLPVLTEQKDGGKILTAGATYYSDTHRNSFSIISVSNNKNVKINSYVYKDGWESYKPKNNHNKIDTIKDMPPLGVLREKCRFIHKMNNKEYEIPLNKLTVYSDTGNINQCNKVDNRKEVLRDFDFSCERSINGSELNISVALSPKMQYNASSLLKAEEYFKFVMQNINNTDKSM